MELRIIWFVLWSVFWAVYFMLDGFVLGTAIISGILGKSDMEKRILLNSVGPVWNGNEVWLITAGGATFAAFPTTYALMFSYLYSALLLLLFALIIRGVALSSGERVTPKPGHLGPTSPSSSPVFYPPCSSAWRSATFQGAADGRHGLSRFTSHPSQSLRPDHRRPLCSFIRRPRVALCICED